MTLPAALDSTLVFTREYFQQDGICRFCWSKDASKELYKISDTFVETPLYCKVKSCLDIDLSECCAEYYPRKICENCFNNIEKFSNFKNFCHYSSKKLIEILEIKREIVDNVEITIEVDYKNSNSNDVIKSERISDDNESDDVEINESRYPVIPEKSQPLTFQKNEDFVSSFSANQQQPELGINYASYPTSSHTFVEVRIKKENNELENSPYDCNNTLQTENNTVSEAGQDNAHNTQIQKENPDSTRNLIQCVKCNMWFPNQKLLLAHMKRKHSISEIKPSPEISCFGCNKLFTDKSSRWSHEVRTCPALRNGYKCSKCGKYLPSRVIYEKHIKSHANKDMIDEPEVLKFQCNKCNSHFPNKMQLIAHNRQAHPKNVEILCFGCSKQFLNRKARWVHEQKDCPELKYGYKCSECNKYLPSRMIHAKHMLNHKIKTPIEISTESIFKCDICNIQFLDKIQIAAHINKEHSIVRKRKDANTDYSCFGCNKKFKHKNARWSHEVRTCPALRNGFKCSNCDKYLPSRKIYEKHMESHYENKKLVEFTEELILSCNKCNENFPNKMQLVTHIKKEHPSVARSDRKDSVCETCGKVYNSTANLKVHVDSVHNRKNIFKCSQCNYKASYKQGLLYHMRTHTGERPYACEFCPHRCATDSNLKKHLRSHYKEQKKQPFECDVCNNKFTFKRNLREHIQIVHEKSPCQLCLHCGKVFLKDKELRQHLTRKHGAKVEMTPKVERKETLHQDFTLKQSLQSHSSNSLETD